MDPAKVQKMTDARHSYLRKVVVVVVVLMALVVVVKVVVGK